MRVPPYLRLVLELPEGEPVELFVPELPGTKRPYVYDIKSVPTNMVYDNRADHFKAERTDDCEPTR